MRFSFRALLVAFTLVAILLGTVVRTIYFKRMAIAGVEKANGFVGYTWDSRLLTPWEHRATLLKKRIASCFGEEYARTITQIGYRSNPDLCDQDLECLAGLNRLTAFYLRPKGYVQLSDQGLKYLSANRHLLRLSLCRATNINGSGLRYLRNNHGISDIDLSGTSLDDSGMENLLPFTRLKDLRLSSTRITDDGIAHLSSLTDLSMIDLSYTAVTSIRSLTPLQGLSSLQLEKTNIDDLGLEGVANLPLEHLCLIQTAVTSDGMRHLSSSSVLSTLSLDGTSVDDVGLRHLSKIETLTSLGLDATYVTSKGVSYLVPLKRLSHLGLAGTYVDETVIDHLMEMPALTNVTLPVQIPDRIVERLREMKPNCKIEIRTASPWLIEG